MSTRRDTEVPPPPPPWTPGSASRTDRWPGDQSGSHRIPHGHRPSSGRLSTRVPFKQEGETGPATKSGAAKEQGRGVGHGQQRICPRRPGPTPTLPTACHGRRWAADPTFGLRKDRTRGGSISMYGEPAGPRADHAPVTTPFSTGPCVPTLLTLAQAFIRHDTQGGQQDQGKHPCGSDLLSNGVDSGICALTRLPAS
jgi:hypothetical protein